MRKSLLLLILSLTVISFNSCDDFYIVDTSVSKQSQSQDPIQEVSISEHVEIAKQEYINNDILHIPNSLMREYVTDSGTWTLDSTGIIQTVNCSLYPNPLMPGVFLNNKGQTLEVVAEDYYYFHGLGIFEHKGRFYSGEVTCEIIVTGDVITVNGGIVR